MTVSGWRQPEAAAPVSYSSFHGVTAGFRMLASLQHSPPPPLEDAEEGARTGRGSRSWRPSVAKAVGRGASGDGR